MLSTTYDFRHLDRLADAGALLPYIRTVDGIPVDHLQALDRWALDLGQRAAAYRDGESPEA